MGEKLEIKVTFKESERWLYDKIGEHTSRGAFIKDVLIKHIKEEESKNAPVTKPRSFRGIL